MGTIVGKATANIYIMIRIPADMHAPDTVCMSFFHCIHVLKFAQSSIAFAVLAAVGWMLFLGAFGTFPV